VNKNKFFILLEIGILIIAPLLLILIPTILFENGHSICLFKKLFNIECLGCGMTRALSCLFHFQIKKSYEFNKLIIIVFPLLSYIYIKHLFFCLKSFNLNFVNYY